MVLVNQALIFRYQTQCINPGQLFVAVKVLQNPVPLSEFPTRLPGCLTQQPECLLHDAILLGMLVQASNACSNYFVLTQEVCG